MFGTDLYFTYFVFSFAYFKYFLNAFVLCILLLSMYFFQSIDSADLGAAQFLAEQNERTKELERKLDLHIEDLERSGEAAILKYISPR